MQWDDIIRLPIGTEVYTGENRIVFDFGTVAPYTKAKLVRLEYDIIPCEPDALGNLMKKSPCAVMLRFLEGEHAGEEGWFDKGDIDIHKIISDEEYQNLAAQNFGRCDFCCGDEAIVWIDDQNNAFIDSAGEIAVMASDKFIRFRVKHCPMCGRRFEGENNNGFDS